MLCGRLGRLFKQQSFQLSARNEGELLRQRIRQTFSDLFTAISYLMVIKASLVFGRQEVSTIPDFCTSKWQKKIEEDKQKADR